jgi:sec-independent protein translocase protein TatB
MPFLSPVKLLIILVIALVVMGPEKLPKITRQIGSLWGDLRKFRDKLESEVRGNFPDLPSTNKIAQAVRSPLSLLDDLAEAHDSENVTKSERLESVLSAPAADETSSELTGSFDLREPSPVGQGSGPVDHIHRVSADGEAYRMTRA